MHIDLTDKDLDKALKQVDELNGIEKIDMLNSIGYYYMHQEGNETSGIIYAQKSRLLSEEILYAEGLANSLFILGRISYYTFDHPSVIEYLNLALPLFINLGDNIREWDCLNQIGNCQLSLGDYSASLETHFKSLQKRQREGDRDREAISLMNIGNCYIRTKELDLALDFYMQSNKIQTELNNLKQKSTLLRNLGNVYIEKRDFPKAIKYYEESVILCEQLKDKYGLGQSYINMGNVYSELENFNKAFELFNKSLDIFTEMKNSENLCLVKLSIGSIFMLNKEPEKALEYMDDALDIATQLNLKSYMEYAYQQKSECYKLLGDFEKVYEEFFKFYELEKKHISESSQIKIKYLSVAHKVDTIQRESDVLSSKNKELEKLNNKLLELNNEKNEFMGIAAHDLKNPLASISLSATTLKKYFKKYTEEKIESHLDKIAVTSKRMNNIIKNLLDINAIESGNFNINKKNIDLSALARYIAEDYEQRSKSKNISINIIQDEEIKIFTDEEAIYEIMENLISNAIKYSNPDSIVEVKLKKLDNVTIEIKDNGLGIQDSEKEKVFQKFSRISNKPTAGENSTGLGLSIVKKLTELINGKIYFESEYGKGTTFTLEFPL